MSEQPTISGESSPANMTTDTNQIDRTPDRVRHRLPERAVLFMLEGLEHTVERVHGPVSEEWRNVADWLASHEYDLSDLRRLFRQRRLPRAIQTSVRKLGGPSAFNRHVSGEQLCWGLRDWALQKWGLMSKTVLAHWGIRSTRHFGDLVFGMISAGRLQKQKDDRVEDFEAVFAFDQAFDVSFRIELTPTATTHGEDRA